VILKRPTIKLLEKLWLKHAYDGFPRDMKVPWTKRAHALNADNYLYLCWKSYGQCDMFTSIYPVSFVNFDRLMTLNKLFFDIDDPKIANSYKSMQSIANWFESEYHYTPRVYFSGKKGFHLYIDFDPIKIQVAYFKTTVRTFINKVMEGSGAEIVDNSAIADSAGVSRVSRIPFTPHPKGETCVPIDPDWELDLVKFMAEEGSGVGVDINKCPKIGDDLLDIAMAGDVEEDMIERQFVWTDKATAKKMQDGLMRIMEVAPRYADGRHRMIWAMLVPRLTILKSNNNYQQLTGDKLNQVNHEVKKAVQEFIEETPETNPDGTMRETMENYLSYADLVLDRLHNQFWSPWAFETFWLEYPDLAKYFRKPDHDTVQSS
jgi:hypothetical protein